LDYSYFAVIGKSTLLHPALLNKKKGGIEEDDETDTHKEKTILEREKPCLEKNKKQNGGMSIPYRLYETRQQNIILNLPLLLNFIEHNTVVDAGQQQQQLQILLKHSTKL
jgi:hypothetical protein